MESNKQTSHLKHLHPQFSIMKLLAVIATMQTIWAIISDTAPSDFHIEAPRKGGGPEQSNPGQSRTWDL